MSRPRTTSPTYSAIRQRAYRARRKAGIRSFWLEVDVEALQERVGGFEDDDALRAYMNELIDDVIVGL